MIDWGAFYDRHPRAFGPTEYLKQAGHTLGGEPISEMQFEVLLARMITLLDLQSDDSVLDLCCGNGVFTNQLAQRCTRVVGVDFSKPLIDVATRDHKPDNVTYHLMNAIDVDEQSPLAADPFDKVIMAGALQHFGPDELETLLTNLLGITSDRRVIVFLLVPDHSRKWAFYDTPRRRVEHVLRLVRGRELMGTWWQRHEIEQICGRLGLEASFRQMDERLHPSQYRLDARIT